MTASDSTPSAHSLEKLLVQRNVVPPEKTSWEREMVRGYVHSFEEYSLPITNASGVKENIMIKEDLGKIATRVWDCATLTAKWLEHKCFVEQGTQDLVTALDLNVKPSADRPIQVLELGAGTGMLSICLAKMGAAVLSTEYGTVVKYLEENCQRNGILRDSTTSKTMVAGRATCRELDWYKANQTLESLFSENEEAVFDLVIITDCTLSARETRGVVDIIDKYSTKGHTKVIIGSCRQREGTPLLLELVKKFQNLREVESSELHPDYKSSRHVIVTFDA